MKDIIALNKLNNRAAQWHNNRPAPDYGTVCTEFVGSPVATWVFSGAPNSSHVPKT